MVKIYSKALKKTISANRIIGKLEGDPKGPTIVFFAGIHGNETSGVFALESFFKKKSNIPINGTVYGISGNLKALETDKRFIDEDLNRLWVHEKLKSIKTKTDLNIEELESKELYGLLKEIIETHSPPFYFIDFHTTSSKTLPFITINDALINRKFSQLFPVPIVLGIEEYLDGPLLSYINKLGYVSLGFESGQHDEVMAVDNDIAFIYLSLVFANILNKTDVNDFDIHYNTLKKSSHYISTIFEVIHLHKIRKDETFKMLNGFESFQKIKKGKTIALSDNNKVLSKHNAQIFMPLYQNQGKDGFFIIRKIKPIFLKLSAFLRNIKADRLLIILPGISWENKDKTVLQVNLKVTKFYAKPIFHLFGYRSKQTDKTHLKLYNRERVAQMHMYKDELWYKKTT